MRELLTSLEATRLSIWVRESGSIWSYPMIITFHAFSMAMLAGVSTLIGLRLLGFGPGVPIVALRKLYPILKVGFVISLVSGAMLTIGDAATMLIAPLF